MHDLQIMLCEGSVNTTIRLTKDILTIEEGKSLKVNDGTEGQFGSSPII